MEFKVRLPKAWSRRRKYIKVGGELHNKVKKLKFQGLSRRKGRLLLGKQREVRSVERGMGDGSPVGRLDRMGGHRMWDALIA